MPFRRVLFVLAASLNLRHVVETVSCLDDVEFECVIMNDGTSSGACDLRIHEAFRRFAPDLLILVPTIVDFECMPSRGYLDALRRDAGLPVVQVFTDLAKPVWQELAPMLVVAADVAVSLDGNGTLTLNRSSRPDLEWLELWTPVTPPEPTNTERDIDVSMLGSFMDFSHRAEALDRLAGYGISVATGGGRETGYAMSIEDYYRTLQRSRIVLNFSRLGTRNVTADGFVHGLKGRVMEALSCGALLLESENKVTPRYFSDGEDFISFTDLEDLIAKIRFYLADEEKRRAIAESGKRVWNEHYTAPIFWTRIFGSAAGIADR